MILHIGFPKCASTTLQSLFAASNALFLGCHSKNPPGMFYHEILGYDLENVFRFGTDKQFKKMAAEKHDVLKTVDRQHNGKTVISLESICFRFTPWDLPTDIKLHRMGRLIPPAPQIIVVHRPIRDFIVSLYKNHLTFGYTGDFQDFLDELVILKDYGWISDLDLENLFSALDSAFENHRILLTNLKTADKFKILFSKLGLVYADSAEVTLNPSPDDLQTTKIRHFNMQRPNRKKLLDWLELHRVFPKDSMSEEELFAMSRGRIAQREYLQKTPDADFLPFVPNNFTWPPAIDDLEQQNKDFIKTLGTRKDVILI